MSTAMILIVDDEPSNLAALRQILGGAYALTFARGGAECLAAARKHKPALILLDIQMPEMDGYAVCRALKSDPLTENTPVIFVSALGEVGDEAAGFACGAVDYIIKPVSPALVLARVRTHLSLVRAATLELYVGRLEIERAKTARLSRILAVLSSTNSTIVRLREPQALIEDACHIAVELGGFGIAWIGMAEADGGALTLAASHGVQTAQRDALLHLVAHARAREPDIPGAVLKSGQAAFCNDVRDRAQRCQTSQDALGQGYLSIAGLPLIVGGKTAGVMVLYAREANSFDDEEMKLLGELGGDISYALQAIGNEKRANFLSCYDALTALPNTALFLDRLDRSIQTARSDGGAVFVIALNLDQFKQLNDTLGRHIGDQVLGMVAKRLGDGLARSCSVARIAADYFAVAGWQASSDEVGVICEQIIALLSEPFAISHQSLHVSARMGVAVYPADADSGESLFKNAEAALKQTKLADTRYLFYSPEINARIVARVDMERMLKAALDGAQFVLYFQPKINLQSGRMVSAEALIRWRHPRRGIVSPLEFISLAEESGLIAPIGEWVIRTVCAQQAAWLRDAIQIVPIALNLSALQFRQGNVLDIVRQALSDNALAPGWVELEITESSVMHHPEQAQHTMRAFRDLGLRLSLDDFGTGYSSLAYLKRFPFNAVKIDRAFVTDIAHNPVDAAIATAIIGMAHSLRMHVIAEGVETEAQLRCLRVRDCDQIQGFFFSRPVPAEDFAAMLVSGKHLELESDAGAEQQTLLIVDDEAAILSSLTRCLRRQGYRILTARNGQEALELLATNAVQVILSDQRMPMMAGAEFLAIAAKLYPDTVRLVLSGYTEWQSIMDVINRGEIHRFLTKPWDDVFLRENILEAFQRYRRRAPHPA